MTDTLALDYARNEGRRRLSPEPMIDALGAELRARGWTVERGIPGEIVWTEPAGRFFTTGSAPGSPGRFIEHLRLRAAAIEAGTYYDSATKRRRGR